MIEPQRWLPARGRAHVARAIMVVPDQVDEDGNPTHFKVWANGSPERDCNGMIWEAETLRRYYDPEPE